MIDRFDEMADRVLLDLAIGGRHATIANALRAAHARGIDEGAGPFARARAAQLMDLLLLAPEVQEEILFLELPPGAQPVSERGLREAVLGTVDWQEQRRRWEGLKGRLASVEHGREGATP